jgi:crossover junction endodeoxyribonuclease RuvC
MIILGLDPGSRVTGYSVLLQRGSGFTTLDCGVLRLTGTDDHGERLRMIYARVTELVGLYKPVECAVETPVYGKDPLAMLKLGRAQAACMLAVINSGLPITEYYPKAVKKAITGRGNASKDQMSYMLYKLIDVQQKSLPNDATDALAVAWCHAMRRKNELVTGKPGKHQNSKGNSWSDFVKQNPERVRD